MDKMIGIGCTGMNGGFISKTAGDAAYNRINRTSYLQKDSGTVDYSRKGGHISKITVKPDRSENTFEVSPRPGNQAFKVTCVSPEGVRREATRDEIRMVRQVFDGSLPNVVDPETDIISDGLQRAENEATPEIWLDLPIQPFPRRCEPPILPLFDGPQFPEIKKNRPPCVTPGGKLNPDFGPTGGMPKIWMANQNVSVSHAQGVAGKGLHAVMGTVVELPKAQ